jgi:hypothetical protein
MEQRVIYTLAFIGSIAALLSILYMGFGISVPESIYSLQPTDAAMPASNFLKPINEVPELMLRFLTADSFLIFGGILLYFGMYITVSEKTRFVAAIGLGIGIFTILLDATEKAFLISYAQQSINRAAVADPALPLLFVIANLKVTGSYAGFLVFGLAWMRKSKLDWTLSSVMILYSVTGVMSLIIPGLKLPRSIFLLLCMILFSWYFASKLKKTTNGV